MATKKQKQVTEELICAAQEVLKLTDWDITVAYATASPYNDVRDADCNFTAGRRTAVITFYKPFFAGTFEEQVDGVTHELLHCSMSLLQSNYETSFETLSPGVGAEVATASALHQVELVVDQLAGVLAPMVMDVWKNKTILD